MVLGFVIDTHSTLEMSVVLRGTYEYPLVTKKSCNRLSLSLGNEPRLWCFHYLGVTIGRVDSPLLPLTIDASSEYIVTCWSIVNKVFTNH